jgi:hypothetical protein
MFDFRRLHTKLVTIEFVCATVNNVILLGAITIRPSFELVPLPAFSSLFRRTLDALGGRACKLLNFKMNVDSSDES